MQCKCGQRHWGRFGAAGLLLADGLAADGLAADGLVAGDVDAGGSVVLQHRAPWSHHGDTWGIPGGARNSDETAVQAAVREAGEEAGVHGPVRPHATHELAHPDWSYTTVLARAPAGLAVQATDAESVEVRWHPIERVTELPLLGAFEAAWPLLRQMLATRALLVVDAANVVGSRPDGWWKDRAGATSRLAQRLSVLTQQGVPAKFLDLPGHTWWPAVVLVTEGQARAAPDAPGIEVIRAEADGDETITAVVTEAVGGAAPHSGTTPLSGKPAPVAAVTVVTADRGLRRRVESAGARVVGPGSLWRIVDELPR